MLKKMLILYSRDDEEWKDHLTKHINVLINAGYDIEIDLLNESRLDTTGEWYLEFESALNRARVIVLLASLSFFNSKLMQSEKIRKRLQMKQKGGFPIFMVLLNNCQWRRFSWMKALPVFPGNGKFLSDLSSTAVDSTMTELTEQIADVFRIKSLVTEGILSYLQLNGVGPVKELHIEAGRRLNIITGDNGFGKSFLLECTWWALSGMWAKDQVLPGDDAKKDDVQIRYRLMTKSGSTGDIVSVSYDWNKQQIGIISDWPPTL